MLKRLVKAYLRRRHGITTFWHRIAPPIGWAPWARVTLRRRVRYVLASRFWRLEERLRAWAYRGEREWWTALDVAAGDLAKAHADRIRQVVTSELARMKAGRWVVLPDRLESIELATASEPDYKSFDKLSDGAGI